MKNNLFKTLTLSACISTLVTANASEVEVLHWWTSGGEAAALKVLKQDMEAKGISWKDVPIAGGGGDAAKTVLSARLTANNPPAAAQALGFDITDLAKQGALGNLNKVADAENWDKVIPKAIQKFAKHEGKWISAPVNVHSTNWVWANKTILDELGIKEPKTWDEFVAALAKVKASGKIALAHGGQAWQDATLFDSAVLSAGGPAFYKKAMVELDEASLTSDTMLEAFNRMAVLRSYVDDNFSGRDWNLASAKVINGEAAFQIMGDWAKGEFLKAGKVANKDFLCFRTPGTEGSVTFNSDQFAMLAVKEGDVANQHVLASAIMSPKFQSAFNVVKGSVPARTDVPNDAFGDCGKKGMKDLASAAKANTLMGSMAHGHAAPASIKSAVYDVVTAHFNGEYDAKEAVKELKQSIALAK